MLQRYSLLRTVSVVLLGLSPLQAVAGEGWSPDVPTRAATQVVHEHSAAPLLIAALGGLVVGAVIANKSANDRMRAAQWQQASMTGPATQAPSCAAVPACETALPAPACSVPAEESPDRFGYYDLSSRRWFETIEDCRTEVEYAQRPTFVRVIDRSTGGSIGTICWVDGEWSVVGNGDVSLEDMAGYQRAHFERSGQRFGEMRSTNRDRYRHRSYRGRQVYQRHGERTYGMSGHQ